MLRMVSMICWDFSIKHLMRVLTRPASWRQRGKLSDPCSRVCRSLVERRMRRRRMEVEWWWGREKVLLQTGPGALITVKDWTLIRGIKTFYESSSCSKLQQHNGVLLQNKPAGVLCFTSYGSFSVNYCASGRGRKSLDTCKQSGLV